MSFINSEQTCGIILKSVSRSERSESHRREFGSERGDITCKDGNPGRTGVAVEREHQPVTIHKSGNRVGFDSAARVASKVYHGGSVQNVYKTITGQPWETALAFTPWRKQFVAVCETVSGPFARYVEAPIRHSTGIAAWRPAWVCPRCGEEAGLDDVDVPPQAGDPCEGCGAIQQWAFDRFTARGELSCTAACAPAGFSADAAPPPAPPAVAPGASGQPSTVGGSFRNVPGARTHCDVWAMCGLPQGVPAPTNSWLYVPLLPAAAGQLQGPALQQWREDPRTVPWWEHAHTALVTSDPVLVATLVEAFVAAVTHAGEALPQELLAEASALPRNTSVHLGWVVRNLLQPDGYITAACQEVCLQLFGGRELPTELNRLSDAFRPPAPLPPSDADEEHVPDDATAALAARRLEQTRGPGCPGSGAATHSRNGEPAEPIPSARERGRARGRGRRGRGGRGANVEAGVRLLQLQELDLPAELRRRVLTLQAAPCKLRGLLRFALRTGLRTALDLVAAACGWKLFFLAPRMLLHRPAGQQSVQANELEQPCDSFRRGDCPAKPLQLVVREGTAPAPALASRPALPGRCSWFSWVSSLLRHVLSPQRHKGKCRHPRGTPRP